MHRFNMMKRSLLSWLLLTYAYRCLAITSWRVPFSIRSSNSDLVRQVPRGGAKEQQVLPYVSVGTIGNKPTYIPESCSDKTRALLEIRGNVLVPTPESLCAGQMEGDTPETVAETLGMVCNVLIIWINPNETFEESLLDLLWRGIQRRIEVGLPKPKVLVVALSSNDEEKETSAARKEQLMLGLFQNWTPNQVNRLEVVTSELELDQVWNDIMTVDEPAPPPLVDLSAFPALLQQVHDALTGTQTRSPELKLVWEDEAYKLSQLEKEVNSELVLLKQSERIEEEELSDDYDESENDDGGVLENDVVQLRVKQPRDPDVAIATELTRQVLSESMSRIRALEVRQQGVWLQVEEDGSNSNVTPLSGFASEANAILQEAFTVLREAPSRHDVLVRIAQELRRLYQEQLESLREFHGRQYEAVLDSTTGDDKKEEHTQAAKSAVEGFREAAHHAIPQLCREGQELRDAGFDYVSTLQGLISDMMEATSTEEQNDDLNRDDEEFSPASRQIPKWLKKLAARAVVLGVNYLQGWLAWQGIRKAAAERDRNMPKFPLF